MSLADASQRQLKAADPRHSVWVSANAGSGKTHVLALRVVRLLLQGAPPSKILCLTFTKAAAANMAERVFERLSRWTQLDDEQLADDIRAVGAASPSAADLELARKLFARVLETPGGLKIQTLHAFCERVLHLFPFEANVPAGFRALDERDAALLREQAQKRALVEAERDPALADAVARVAAAVGADGFATLIAETARLREALALHGPPDVFAGKLAERLGLQPGEDEAEIERQMREGGGGPVAWRRWAKALATGSINDRKLADALTGAAMTPDPALQFGLYFQAFFTTNQTPRKTLATKATAERFPDMVDELYAERDRLHALLDRKRAAAAVSRSRDLYRLSRACEVAYASAKAKRSALDFDDLIAKTQGLFERGDAAWVLYKLDRGVEHILVDEAQDTSRAQWVILAKLAEDFMSGQGAGPEHRTFFAVGDEKQSIFSFQGAAPHLFDEMKRYFAKRLGRAQRPFVDQRLIHSFRSSPIVLDAVDKVFASPEVWRGVSAAEPKAPPHEAIKAMPGLVEIWPTLAGDPPPEPGDWEAPLDAQSLAHPANVLAERVAAAIAALVAPGSPERIVDRSGALRPIRPGDVLILVRSRGPLFEAMTRALRRARVPAAGADRLTLGDHIAVRDLCAAARAALNPDDDLALAAVLKSPLIGLDDDALIRLCPNRPGSLSAALAAAPEFAAAEARLARWRARAGAGPFDFFAALVGAEGGRRALVGRLGPEAGDAIDEFLARALAHEQGEAPSLTRFLDEIEAADTQIKRDMEAAADEVRVMTVHAAKGLEAPIVFLPDAGGAPGGRHDPKWLRLPPLHAGQPPLHVWVGPAGEDSAETAKARALAREAAAGEHRRLLYVAMTRAAQRLIVASYRGVRENPPDAWANLIAAALAPHAREAPSPWNPQETVLRLGEGACGQGAAAPSAPPPPPPPPLWALEPAPREVAYAPVAPARRVAGEIGPERLARIEEGRLAHKLLQNLPALVPERRRAAAAAFLARAASPPARRDALIDRLLALIETPALAPLFAPGSRAEVAFAATLARAGGQAAPLEGRIDRLAPVGDEIWIADYKSGAAVERPEYRRQLALYRAAALTMFPERKIRAFLLWIESGQFQELPAANLDDAYLNWSREGIPAASPS